MDAETAQPRLCHLRKVPDYDGYGFKLCSEEGKLCQFIGEVEPGSPAAAAGLRDGNRIVEVNGENVNGESQSEVTTTFIESSLYNVVCMCRLLLPSPQMMN